MKAILESVGLHWRMQAILVQGGLVKTILENVAEPANCMQAILMAGGLVRTILEIVCLHWRMQAIEGGLVKAILEIVAVLCRLLASHPHGR